MKESEKKLLLEQGVLENYYNHVVKSEFGSQTLLSRYYGVYQIKIENMNDITCFIMDNLLGHDFINIERIYDLKGSTKGRIVNLTEDEK